MAVPGDLQLLLRLLLCFPGRVWSCIF